MGKLLQGMLLVFFFLDKVRGRGWYLGICEGGLGNNWGKPVNGML